MRKLNGILITLLAAFITLTGCDDTSSGSKDPDASGTGTLDVAIRASVTSTTLPAGEDFTPDHYRIMGSGPGNSSFEETVDDAGTSASIEGLVFGIWTITVVACNSSDDVIGGGSTTITVQTGGTTACMVIVTPFSGEGSVEFIISWDVQCSAPLIQARLIRIDNILEDIELDNSDFIIDGTTATATLGDVPSGYYTFTIYLYDETTGEVNPYIGGSARMVRIADNLNTAVTLAITANSDYGYGEAEISIEVDMKGPIEVELDGDLDRLPYGDSMAVTATAPAETETVYYTWYLNGELVAEGDTYTVNDPLSGLSELPVGWYNLDVIAFNEAGDRGGSVTHYFEVYIPAEVPNAPTDLQAQALSTESIELTWYDDADNETGFSIERSPDGTTFTETATVAADTSSYTDTGLEEGTLYYYRVSAFNDAGSSDATDIISVPTQSSVEPQPVVHYEFENSLDDSGSSGVSLTAYGSPEFVPGIVGNYALEFDGTTGQYVGDSGNPDLALETCSISFWLYKKDDGTFLVRGRGAWQEDGWTIDAAESYGFCNYNAEGLSGYATIGGTGSLPVMKWNHIVLIIDQSIPGTNGFGVIQSYINGQLARTHQMTHAMLVTETRVLNLMGDQSYGSSPGILDDFRIYSYSLSEEEITDLYNMAPAAYYTFENSLEDSGTSGITGTGVNSPAYSTGIVRDYALSLTDADQSYVNLGTQADHNYFGIQDTNEVTVCAWVKLNSSADAYPNIISTSANPLWFHFSWNSSFNCFYIRGCIRLAEGDTNYVISQSAYTIPLNEWHHVAYSYGQGYLKVYLDGVEAGSLELSGDMYYQSDSSWTIGRTDGQDTEIDDLRIYNRVLTVSEIQAVYSLGSQ